MSVWQEGTGNAFPNANIFIPLHQHLHAFSCPMKNHDTDTSLFQHPVWVSVFALTAAIVWGWAYPLIKIGFSLFGITQAMTGGKMLFAGIRFFISGMIILAIAGGSHRSFKVSSFGGWLYILAFSIVNTSLHYAFFYFGLSHSEGARAALLNSLSVFAVVILACIFFRNEHMTLRKAIGCLLGALGLLSLHWENGAGQSGFSWMGDGMIILNALCGAFASLMTRGLAHRIDVFTGTGYSLAIGGFTLAVPGIIMHGEFLHSNVQGWIVLLLLIAISSIGFALYNKLLSCNPMGKVAIYNSLIPVVGALTSCLCLGEAFRWEYVLAGILASSGIFVINKGKA